MKAIKLKNFVQNINLKSNSVHFRNCLPKLNTEHRYLYSAFAKKHKNFSTQVPQNDETYSDQELQPSFKECEYTTAFRIKKKDEYPRFPTFRLIDNNGRLLEGVVEPDISVDLAHKLYGTMVRLQCLDSIFYDAQRQGRISFYMTHFGEEAAVVGSAAALSAEDTIFGQYREAGALMWRGFTLQQFSDQCFSNSGDEGKGRQMPVHYGSKELNFHPISSPLGTQIIQAAGSAYANKLHNPDKAVMCYFGDGAASEGDFHAGLNFAATLGGPLIYFCRNNGYAISTPISEQFKGDGIISRAAGYGIPSVRIDGNDMLAVYQATKEARKLAVENSEAVLIEAMTYRVGHHSTSDDSTRYRDIEEIKMWQKENNPVSRFKRYMQDKGWLTDSQDQSLRDTERLNVIKAMEIAERKPKPSFDLLFEDVYARKTSHLARQEKEMRFHLEQYPEVVKKSGSDH